MMSFDPPAPSAEKPASYDRSGDKFVDDSGRVDSSLHSSEEFHLQRQLKNRHVAMISIGGVIGTGLFLGTASSLKAGGPVGLLLGYIFIGSICYCIMISVGEMIAYLPVTGGYITLAERFVDPALSFAMGWNVWYSWTLTLPAELSAAATLIDFWTEGVNNAVWITICLVVAISINMAGVGMSGSICMLLTEAYTKFLGEGVYGEAEFVFSSIKVITIVGLIILGIILDLGGGPDHDRIGFRYWKNPGPFVQYDGIPGVKGQFLGFAAVFVQAAFSYVGTEVVALAAAEAVNPRRNLPKAVRRVVFRILVFYIGGTFIIGLLVPSNNPLLDLDTGNASASPFVIAIDTAGIRILPSIINAALLTSAWSAGSSDLYLASRALYGLASVHNAPKIFLRTSRSGLPYVSVIFCSIFSLLSYMVINNSSGEVFTWFSNLTALAGLLTWAAIALVYIRFHRGFTQQGYDRRTLPYYSNLQPFAAWYAMIASLVACFFSGWEVFLKDEWSTATFVTNYLPLIIFLLLYVSAKFIRRRAIVKPADMDFESGLREIEAITYKELPPKSWLEAVWMHLM